MRGRDLHTCLLSGRDYQDFLVLILTFHFVLFHHLPNQPFNQLTNQLITPFSLLCHFDLLIANFALIIDLPFPFIYGMGSYPPRLKGLHLRTLRIPSAIPLKTPYFNIAPFVYSEQVG